MWCLNKEYGIWIRNLVSEQGIWYLNKGMWCLNKGYGIWIRNVVSEQGIWCLNKECGGFCSEIRSLITERLRLVIVIGCLGSWTGAKYDLWSVLGKYCAYCAQSKSTVTWTHNFGKARDKYTRVDNFSPLMPCQWPLRGDGNWGVGGVDFWIFLDFRSLKTKNWLAK
jgi:hypothetical protein